MVELRTERMLTWLTASSFDRHPGLCHAFSTRLGGASRYPYRGLNLGLKTQDLPACVQANRIRFLSQFGIRPEEAVSLSFVHSNRVAYIGEEDKGKGYLDLASVPAEADGMVTNAKRCALFVTFADCPPVLFYDPYHQAIGACHAGWRGTVSGIAGETVRAMSMYFESDPAEIEVVIGPCIGPDVFEVSTEVIEAVQGHSGNWMDLLRESPYDHKALFDIRLALTWQLEGAGIRRENIDHIDLCTFSRNDLFFSHRRSFAETGRMGAFIMLDGAV